MSRLLSQPVVLRDSKEREALTSSFSKSLHDETSKCFMPLALHAKILRRMHENRSSADKLLWPAQYISCKLQHPERFMVVREVQFNLLLICKMRTEGHMDASRLVILSRVSLHNDQSLDA